MKVKDSKTCVNPWIGLSIIAGICLVMALAVFVEFSGPTLARRPSAAHKGGKGFVSAAFPSSAADAGKDAVDKITF